MHRISVYTFQWELGKNAQIMTSGAVYMGSDIKAVNENGNFVCFYLAKLFKEIVLKIHIR